MTLASCTQLGSYEILSLLGTGGMGEVYLAEDIRPGRKVALKVLAASYAQDADRLRRFEQEARTTSTLNHPNIPTVYDVSNYEGSPYLVSKSLEGDELRAQMNGGPLPARKAVEYAQEIAEVLKSFATHGEQRLESGALVVAARVKQRKTG